MSRRAYIYLENIRVGGECQGNDVDRATLTMHDVGCVSLPYTPSAELIRSTKKIEAS
jgi:hypothetical protein